MGIHLLRFTNIAANIFGYKTWCIMLLLKNHFPHCSHANCLKKMVLAKAQEGRWDLQLCFPRFNPLINICSLIQRQISHRSGCNNCQSNTGRLSNLSNIYSRLCNLRGALQLEIRSQPPVGPCVVGLSILNLMSGHPSQYYFNGSGLNFRVHTEQC